jgi:hypothetical protein
LFFRAVLLQKGTIAQNGMKQRLINSRAFAFLMLEAIPKTGEMPVLELIYSQGGPTQFAQDTIVHTVYNTFIQM